jgi:hypothetical protein
MSLDFKIHGHLIKTSTRGYQIINKLLEEKVLPIVIDTITVDAHTKAVEFASGIDSPAHKDPRQAPHPVGRSSSGYNSTGKLADSITVVRDSTTESTITTPLEYAPWLEFGTGIFGPSGHKIFPTKGSLMVFPFQGKTIAAAFTKGQRPQPFFRGTKWFLIDNFEPTKEKIKNTLKGRL